MKLRSLGLLAVLVSSSAFAQEAGVQATIDTFHAALNSFDMSKMESVWAHDPNVMLVNPRDKTIAIGWDAVKKDWEANWSNYTSLKVTQIDGPHIVVKDDVAWSIGIAHADVKMKNGNTISAPTLETDVFEQRGGQWLLVSHSASRIPQ